VLDELQTGAISGTRVLETSKLVEVGPKTILSIPVLLSQNSRNLRRISTLFGHTLSVPFGWKRVWPFLMISFSCAFTLSLVLACAFTLSFSLVEVLVALFCLAGVEL
jgi:hypothetical protein